MLTEVALNTDAHCYGYCLHLLEGHLIRLQDHETYEGVSHHQQELGVSDQNSGILALIAKKDEDNKPGIVHHQKVVHKLSEVVVATGEGGETEVVLEIQLEEIKFQKDEIEVQLHFGLI